MDIFVVRGPGAEALVSLTASASQLGSPPSVPPTVGATRWYLGTLIGSQEAGYDVRMTHSAHTWVGDSTE